MIPLLFRRIFQPDSPLKLGGNWFSLITVHLGGIFLWIGIFLTDDTATLHGIAYAMWFISMLPIAYELWQIVRNGLSNLTEPESVSSTVKTVTEIT